MKHILLALVLAISYSTSAQAQAINTYAVGGRIICALSDSGALNCATDNASTRLRPPASTPLLTSIAAGDVHVCGLTETGSSFCWGDNDFGQLNSPDGEIFLSISAGINFSCGVTTDKRALCWGLNTQGNTEPPIDSRFLQVALDSNSSCGLGLDSRVSCWGQSNLAERLDERDTFVKIAVNNDNVCGLTDTSEIRCRFGSTAPQGSGMIDVAMTKNLVCGVQSIGDLVCTTNNGTRGWPEYLDGQVADINRGPDIVALYGGNGYSTKMCYATIDDGFNCFGREFQGEQLLPDTGSQQLDAPINLSADVYSDTTIELLWEVTTDINNVFTLAGADILRNGELLDSTTNRTSYIDDTLVPGVIYEYTVALFTSIGERGQPSSSLNVNTDSRSAGDMDSGYTPVDRPLAPANLSVTTYSQKQIELFWDRPASIPDNFNGYEIWKNHVFYAFTRGVSFFDDNLQRDSNSHYNVVAVSRNGSILGFSGIDVDSF